MCQCNPLIRSPWCSSCKPSNLNKIENKVENKIENKERISRDEVFMEMTDSLAKRSVCKRAKVGAIIVKNGRPISVGYNGPPSGAEHCVKCKGKECNVSIHAEMNAIAFAAKEGVAIDGCTMYCSMDPCIQCAKIIINSGIKKVVFKEKYRLSEGIEFLKGYVTVIGFDGESSK